jgi:hypothetical protein
VKVACRDLDYQEVLTMAHSPDLWILAVLSLEIAGRATAALAADTPAVAK